jgi:uncharacterized protein YuzE
MLKFTYDAEASASYLYFSTNEIHNTITLHDADVMINLDLDADGDAVGLEVIDFRGETP